MKYLIAILVVVLAFASNASAQSQAKTMHDTYCIMCHGTELYTRESRIARDYESLREQVARWQANAALNWSDTEINIMTNWLAERYYGLSCPEEC